MKYEIIQNGKVQDTVEASSFKEAQEKFIKKTFMILFPHSEGLQNTAGNIILKIRLTDEA